MKRKTEIREPNMFWHTYNIVNSFSNNFRQTLFTAFDFSISGFYRVAGDWRRTVSEEERSKILACYRIEAKKMDDEITKLLM